jgi:3-oxoacyl-[acyl-carrier protein] reductase
MSHHTPLAGKKAIVTGAARGIGAAIATRLAADGAEIAITYSKSGKEAEALAATITNAGGKAFAFKADASELEILPAKARDIAARLGGIDILVNNAGVLINGLIGEIDEADYRRTMDVNVHAVFAMTNALVPLMKSGARIINISSVLGERAIFPGLGIYNASKFAVIGFTRSWALDLAAKGILVNAVQPGPIATDMNPENGPQADMMRAAIALGRFGQPEDVASAVAFFAGPDSAYVTGVTMRVDGGLNA